jgi:type I restriction enzyme S subunit
MEVRPGYKLTEVGIIPEDWRVKLLPEVCSFRGGKAHEQHISDTGRYVCVNSKFISSDGAVRKYSAANFCPAKKGDVLMVMSDLPNGRALAKAYLVEADDTFAVNQRVCALTAYRDSPEYLFYVLNRSPYFLKFDDGVNQTHLLNPVFQKCPLALPPTVEEQRAIAAALRDVDALLGGLDRLIAKKRDLKQAVMQQLLTGQTRLPGFRGEWEVKRLGDVAPLQRGFDLPNPQLKRGTYPVVYSNGILNHHAAFRVRGPGVVTGRSGTIGKVTFVQEDYWPHNTSLWVTSFKSNVPKLVFYLYTRIGLERFATGSGVPTLNRNDVHTCQVVIPPTSAEQAAIAAVLSDMDAELSALEARRDKTRALKQGMMQELLTGRTRLVSPETAHA